MTIKKALVQFIQFAKYETLTSFLSMCKTLRGGLISSFNTDIVL